MVLVPFIVPELDLDCRLVDPPQAEKPAGCNSVRRRLSLILYIGPNKLTLQKEKGEMQ
jgi:hypothetical protein